MTNTKKNVDAIPSVLPVLSSHIPQALRELNQWVCWRFEPREGNPKPAKALINPKPLSNGRLIHAKSNDPSTWGTFDEALATCGRSPELKGIGLCVSPTDNITGLDLDGVLSETGELTAEAVQILERFKGTYCERSPSGKGYRLFCYGKAQRSGKSQAKWLEVYTHPSNRYFTVTGQYVEGHPKELTHQQEALDWLHERFMEKPKQSTEGERHTPPMGVGRTDMDDNELIDKAKKAKNGAEFERLWHGDTTGQNGDWSAADLALCNLLAFWTNGDADRIDRIYRQSKLMRDKWDNKHYADGRTYGQATIEKAIADMREGYTGTHRKKHHKGGNDEDHSKQVEWLKQFVYLTSEDVYVEVKTAYTFKPSAFKQLAERKFPKGWESVSARTLFAREGGTFARHDCYRPGQPKLVIDTTSVDGAAIPLLNTYRAPTLPQPQRDEALEELFIHHLHYLCGDDENFLEQWLNWMATLVQRPGVKVNWMPLVISLSKGTGKGLVADILTACLGANNVGKLSNECIGGTFQDAYVGKQLLVVDEFKMFDDAQAKLNEYKVWLTDARVTVNRKGRPQVTMDNVLNFMAFSNYENAANFDRDERRYMVAINYKSPKADAYYQLLAQAFLPQCGGSVASLLYMLLNRDISGFNPYAPAKNTAAKQTMIDGNLTGLQQSLKLAIESKDGAFAHDLITWVELRWMVWKFEKNILHTVGSGGYLSDPLPLDISNRLITTAAKAVGIRLLGQKRLEEGNPQKTVVYCVRNFDEWECASEGAIRQCFISRPVVDKKG